jgi:hypothetical protein
MTADYYGKPIGRGDLVHNIESGWCGVVLGFEPHPHYGDPMAKMIGINHLAIYIERRKLRDALDHDDIQWHAPRDLCVDLEARDIVPPIGIEGP